MRRSATPWWQVLLALAVVGMAAACAQSARDTIRITLMDDSEGPARIRVSGLSSREAADLAAAGLDTNAWNRLLRVTTGDHTQTVAGRHSVAGSFVDFEPAFPFDPGRSYRVEFDPSQLPTPRSDGATTATIALPDRAATPPVHVTAVYPSSGEWPENLLRFYVHFSGPMARRSGAAYVRLVDHDGVEIVDALLPATTDFWSPDQRRYTVLFDPGRVKRGVQPNVDLGRALVEGRHYAIEIDQAWPDAEGRPLARGFTHPFVAGRAQEAALSLNDWTLSSPAVGSRATLVVSVPSPLDHALFGRTVGVASSDGTPVDGTIEVAQAETEWHFTPATPWERDAYTLVVLSALEDPAGNRPGRAFEVLPSDPAADAELPERLTLPITLE